MEESDQSIEIDPIKWPI